MAQINSVFGTITGKIDNVTTRNWQGINVMARMPQSYTDANTAVQQENRNAFSITSKILSAALPVVRVGFKAFRNRTTPFAQALKENLPAVRAMLESRVAFNQGFHLSRGGGVKVTGFNAIADLSAGTLKVTWDPEVPGDARRGDDLIYMAALDVASDPANEETFLTAKLAASSLGEVTRSAGVIEMPYSRLAVPGTSVAWVQIFTVSSTNGEVSNPQ